MQSSEFYLTISERILSSYSPARKKEDILNKVGKGTINYEKVRIL